MEYRLAYAYVKQHNYENEREKCLSVEVCDMYGCLMGSNSTHQWPTVSPFLALPCMDQCIPETDSDSVPGCHLDKKGNKYIYTTEHLGEDAFKKKKKRQKKFVRDKHTPGEQLSKLKSPQSTSNTTSSSGCVLAAWKSPIHLVTMFNCSQRISPSPD